MIEAYRVFFIAQGRLVSPVYRYNWEPGVNKAMCNNLLGGPIPHDNCECGFHAHRLPKAAFDTSFIIDIVALVGLSGRIIEGTQGYRAAEVTVLGLFRPHRRERLSNHTRPIGATPRVGPEFYNADEILQWLCLYYDVPILRRTDALD